MARRDTVWIPWTLGSITTVAGTQTGVDIDIRYLAEAGAEFKGTILAIKGYLSISQDVPSNALERFAVGCRVQNKQESPGDVDLFTEASKAWFWRLDGFIGGPGGDSSALVNVMAPYVFPIDGRSKRLVGFNENIVMSVLTDGVSRVGAAGRLLLLEA